MVKRLFDEHLPLACFAAFFVFIGVFQLLADLRPKTSLPTVYLDEFTPEEKAQIRHSVKQHLNIWQADFNRTSKSVTIEVVRDIFTNAQGERLSGLYKPGERVIRVYAGRHMELPSLYHELCHLNEDSGTDHSDPRWPEWEAREAQIIQWILYQRRNPHTK